MNAQKQISRRSRLGLALALCLSATLNICVAYQASLTTDEPRHVEYGMRVLQAHPDRIQSSAGYYDSQMPASALNAAPLAIASSLEARGLLPRLSERTNLMLTRTPTVFASLALAVFVYLWAFELYGEASALTACLLFAISPSMLAHGTLATNDMYHALGAVGSLFFLRRFLLRPDWKSALAAAFALALAQITKPFAILLYVVAAVALICLMFRHRRDNTSATAKHAAIFTGLAALCFVIVLNISFCFDRTFKPASFSIQQASHDLGIHGGWSRLQQLPILHHVVVPVPYPFIQGFALMHRDETYGETFGNIYLLGELRDSQDPKVRGFKSYYAVGYFFKEPIALQILFLWGLVWVCRHRTLQDFAAAEGLLLVTAGIIFGLLSFFSKAQIGIRHILPVLAIETIIAGAPFHDFSSQKKAQKAVLVALVLWIGISVATYFPQMIPYMNEWAGDRRLSYRLLADSNLDWGQDTYIVQKFLRDNPDVTPDPPALIPGRILVRANRLTGVNRWESATFLKSYKPVAQVGYAHFLFVITPEDVRRSVALQNSNRGHQPEKH